MKKNSDNNMGLCLCMRLGAGREGPREVFKGFFVQKMVTEIMKNEFTKPSMGFPNIF